MRIFAPDLDCKLDEVDLLLRPEEAAELRDALNCLLSRPPGSSHEHVADAEYQKEITVSVYTPGEPGDYSERYRRLIAEDR